MTNVETKDESTDPQEIMRQTMQGYTHRQRIPRSEEPHPDLHFKSCLNYREEMSILFDDKQQSFRKPPVPSRELVLLVGDDTSFQMSLGRLLETGGYTSRLCTQNQATALSARQDFSVILLDMPHDDEAVRKTVGELQQRFSMLPTIVLDRTGKNRPMDNLQPVGIFSRLSFPCSRTTLLHDIDLAVKFSQTLKENMRLRQSFGIPTQEPGFCDSPFLSEIQRRQIMMYAKTECHVLLMGEKGTEKNLVAQQIHGNSSRKHKPLIAVPCHRLIPRVFDAVLFGGTQDASLSASGSRIGLLELAREGTIYFDRISEMPLSIQAKLCRVLKEGRLQRDVSRESLSPNFRMIAGTRIDLDDACKKGKFLEELLNHFRSVTIPLPSLREIKSDIPALADSLAEEFSRQNGTERQQFSDAAMGKLQHHAWPGNNRELRNVILWACSNTKGFIIPEQNIVFNRLERNCGEIGLAGLTMAEVERRLLIETLSACGGNRAESARRLGVSEKTIYNKFKQHKLKGVV